MSKDFTENMISMIDQAVKEKARKEDHLVDECLQHIRFCQLKCQSFRGREDILQSIKKLVTNGKNDQQPLVVHGESGSGKTSIIAMAAKMMSEWRKDKPLVILRFLGTTQDSSSVLSLLYSMTSQLERCLKLPVSQPTDNIDKQKERFWLMVHNYQDKHPLIIMLDSLDQLDEQNDARKLFWMLADEAKGSIILSTLEEPQYECFPVLQDMITEPSNFIKVPKLSRENCFEILSSWFKTNKRCITSSQMDMLLEAFNKCSIPLFLKLSFDEAVQWRSNTAPDQLVLYETARASIDHLFNRLEKHHGKILFSRALVYLTTAKNGASEVELEDILSCDDDVLNDVYMYWTPPIRRLPPLLLVRIKTDLEQYLVDRGADGLRVLYWYHRQFIEAAEAKYCSDEATMKVIHQNLANYFGGEWADGREKPYTNLQGVNGQEDRFVSSQPLLFKAGHFNLRRLKNLPFHSIKAGNADMVITKCLTNLEFLNTKMKAIHIMSVLDDFKMAAEMFPEKSLISSILNALHLSKKGLKIDPAQIVPQMLQRLAVNKDTVTFLQQCRDYPHTYLEPNKSLLDLPGGQLLRNIATHNGEVSLFDLTTDGKIALTVCDEEEEVFIWNIETTKRIRAVKSSENCSEAYFCMNDKCIALNKEEFIQVEDSMTGSTGFIIRWERKAPFCVAGENKNIIVVFIESSCTIHNLEENGSIIGKPELAETEIGFGRFGISRAKAGSNNYVAMTDEDQHFINILDLKGKKFFPQFRGFPRYKDEEGNEVQHEVEAIAITPDETCLVFTTMFTSEVVFSDFQGTILRSIPPNKDRSFSCIELSPDGSHLFLGSDRITYIYSFYTLQEDNIIEHPSSVKKVKMISYKCIVTMCEDNNLRIWDVTREKLQKRDNSSFLEHVKIRYCLLLDNPRYILIHGKTNNNQATLAVYDIFKEQKVKESVIRLADDSIPSYLMGVYKTRTWNQVNVVKERKIHTIDLDRMSVTMTSDGYMVGMFGLHQGGILYTAKSEILCLSKGSINLKLYDQSSGKATKVIKAGQLEKFDKLLISKSGIIACARSKDNGLYLFNVVNGTFLYTIEKEKEKNGGYCVFINNKGTLLLYSVDESLPGSKLQNKVRHIVLWNIQNKREVGRMFDLEYEEKYRAEESSEKHTGIYELFELDEKRILLFGMDYIIRVHDINTGKLLHRLEGHFSFPKVFIEDKCPYLLTYAKVDKEGTIRLWDKHTYLCLATFTLEKNIEHISLSPDGKFFTSIMSRDAKKHLVQWRIHNGPYDTTVNEADYPCQFSSKVKGEGLVFREVDMPVPEDPTDMDSDPDVIQ